MLVSTVTVVTRWHQRSTAEKTLPSMFQMRTWLAMCSVQSVVMSMMSYAKSQVGKTFVCS